MHAQMELEIAHADQWHGLASLFEASAPKLYMVT